MTDYDIIITDDYNCKHSLIPVVDIYCEMLAVDINNFLQIDLNNISKTLRQVK